MKVNITLDDQLMKRVDEYADQNYMSRSGLISLATTNFLNAADVTTAIKDMAFALRKIADNNAVDSETLERLEDCERLLKLLSYQK